MSDFIHKKIKTSPRALWAITWRLKEIQDVKVDMISVMYVWRVGM